MPEIVPICQIQGSDLFSPLAEQSVLTRGVVTGLLRNGFFIQDEEKGDIEGASDAVFVFSPDWKPQLWSLIDVQGKVIDYQKDDTSKPVTQIAMQAANVIRSRGKRIEPVELTPDLLNQSNQALAQSLNSLEGMLVKISAGARFISPSNRYGDYVVSFAELDEKLDTVLQDNGGVLIDQNNPLRWYPGFRIKDYALAPRLNVGSILKNDVVGPLNYRVESWQVARFTGIDVQPSFVDLKKSSITPKPSYLSVMTVNGFNLDPKIESPSKVMNPKQDVDDDWGDGRFHGLAQAIVLQGNSPDIIALQEIQDNDGAEISEETDASDTYALLIKTLSQLSGIEYQWVDIAPDVGADGGQPGGNIRNGYLFNPERVRLKQNSVKRLGVADACYEDSRKPLVSEFVEIESGESLVCINVHLASKRHQMSIFAPTKAGVDHRLPVREQQCELIHDYCAELKNQNKRFYVTGDFNDTEFSQPLKVLCKDLSTNLVMNLPEHERYDYNHRGKLQVLMHGIVANELADACDYEIIHGNELIGVQPGADSSKASDHAYVIAGISLTT